MIIKKFVGKTEEEAIELAKKELGNSIVIMNVKSVKKAGLLGLFGAKQVEVTVAMEEENNAAKKNKKDKTGQVPAAAFPENEGKEQTVFDSQRIEKKLESLQSLLESQMKNQVYHTAYDPTQENDQQSIEMPVKKRQKEEQTPETAINQEQDKFIRLMYHTMIENEVDEKYANQIVAEIEKSKNPNIPLDYLLASVYQKMILRFGKSEGIDMSENHPKVVIFIGPTGVGKTTTIAKVASKYSMDGKKKIALLTADTYRIAATEQLRTYANILEVPFRVIYTEEEMQKAIQEYAELDYIFVDTTGHSHQNEEQLENTKNLLNAIDACTTRQTFLVLSATTKYSDLLKIAKRYQTITQYQLIFTKLDETTSVGNLLNVKLYADAPIAYITTGQNVPDNIEQFNPQKMVKQILGGNIDNQ